MLLGTVVSIKVSGAVEYKGQNQTLSLVFQEHRLGRLREIILAASCRINSSKENLKKKPKNLKPDW